MKFSKEILTAVSVLCFTTGMVMAKDDAAIQAYAHPTLFGSQGHTLVTADSDVVIGGKIYKPCKAKSFDKKEKLIYNKRKKGEKSYDKIRPNHLWRNHRSTAPIS